jgi:uncharacterized protein (TIGR03437 family)
VILLTAVLAGMVSASMPLPGQELPRKAGAEGREGQLRRWMVILDEPPLAERVTERSELRSAFARGERGRIEEGQKALKRTLRSRGIRTLGSVHTVMNSVFVLASPSDAVDLAAIPGVKRVVASEPVYRAGNRAGELVSAPKAWNALGGVEKAGVGVRIGVVDSGIDPSHPAFQDESLEEVAKYCRQEAGECDFTNRKIIAARSYVRMLALPEYPEDSRPDDESPRDRVGHGTAIASLAAGVEHESPIGKMAGVAPKAFLGNYKVFGSPGVNDVTFTDVVSVAMEDALYDGMDVVTLSLSFPAVFGPNDKAPADCSGLADGAPCDPRVEVVQRVSRLGMEVVIAAGNEGDMALYLPGLNSIRSPGTTPEAITVGATSNAHQLFQSARLEGEGVPENLLKIAGLFGNGPKPPSPLTAKLVDVRRLEDDGKACSALPSGSLNSAIALIEATGCSLRTKVTNAQNAGARAVLFMRAEGNNFVFAPGGLLYTGVPLLLIGHDNGKAIRDFLEQNPDREATLDPAVFEVETPDDAGIISYFSSMGPAIGTHAIKPEVVAPGSDIYAATQNFDPNSDLFDASRYAVVQGTSFAVPLVAGAVALSRQTLPDLPSLPERERAAILKSTVVNTADPNVGEYDAAGRLVPASVRAMGAGMVDARSALSTAVTVSPATLSFGALTDRNFPQSQSLVFRNHLSEPVALRLSVQQYIEDRMTRFRIEPSSFTLAAGAVSQPVRVTISDGSDGSKPSPGAYEGMVVVEGAGAPFSIPYLYVVSDGVPYNLIPLSNFDFVGQANERLRGGFLFKVIDKFGAAVPNVPVTWRTVSGGGEITEAYPSIRDPRTDVNGIGEAIEVFLGDRLGEQVFEAEVPGLPPLQFIGNARLRPMIESGGVVNAASGDAGEGVAPGSIVSIHGIGLSEFTLATAGPALPLSLAGVSVSFDEPSRGVSVPGRVMSVSSDRVDVQLPWEVQGLPTVLTKVSVDGFTSTSLYEARVTDVSPALWTVADAATGQSFVEARDESGNRITSENRARRGMRVVLFANGLGPVDNRPPSGEPASEENPSPVSGSVTIKVGERDVPVETARLRPGTVGVYEIVIRMPDDLALDPAAPPCIVAVNGISSRSAKLPVGE